MTQYAQPGYAGDPKLAKHLNSLRSGQSDAREEALKKINKSAKGNPNAYHQAVPLSDSSGRYRFKTLHTSLKPDSLSRLMIDSG